MPSRQELANAIRALSMDAIQKSNSGHPGAPMGMADIAEVLWRDFLKYNPTNPNYDVSMQKYVKMWGFATNIHKYAMLHTSLSCCVRSLKSILLQTSLQP